LALPAKTAKRERNVKNSRKVIPGRKWRGERKKGEIPRRNAMSLSMWSSEEGEGAGLGLPFERGIKGQNALKRPRMSGKGAQKIAALGFVLHAENCYKGEGEGENGRGTMVCLKKTHESIREGEKIPDGEDMHSKEERADIGYYHKGKRLSKRRRKKRER